MNTLTYWIVIILVSAGILIVRDSLRHLRQQRKDEKALVLRVWEREMRRKIGLM